MAVSINYPIIFLVFLYVLNINIIIEDNKQI